MVLLDSQALVWLLDDNPRLGADARELIGRAPVVHVSAASVWELTIKAMLGKLAIPPNLPRRLTDQGLVLLSITAEHAAGIEAYPELAKHDPFDRLLMAQAELDGLQLLTANRVLLGLGRAFVIDATT